MMLSLNFHLNGFVRVGYLNERRCAFHSFVENFSLFHLGFLLDTFDKIFRRNYLITDELKGFFCLG